ncbi:MAG: ribonuclease III [Lachnospiraceae bacterium]|nr:ribonuclease III [Lachnospiraceae bacterium]
MGESIDYDSILALYDQKAKDIRTYSPSVLAYIGDTVFDLFVRASVIGEGNSSVNKMHKKCSDMVKASSQARLYERIEPMLSEEEADVMRRGRNSHQKTMAKNASAGDYHKATGLEALIGYLYMTGQNDRLFELMKVVEER